MSIEKKYPEAEIHYPEEKITLSEAVVTVIRTITRRKYQVLIAGGAVRDLMMNKPCKDIDLCTDAKPEELQNVLEGQGIKVVMVGQAFGVTVAIINGEKIEIATFHSDTKQECDVEKPTISYDCTVVDDAQRRDLTINGLYYCPDEHVVIDFVGGLEDIRDEVLRFIGSPIDRINEDYLRMMRYMRFHLKTGFILNEKCLEIIKNNAPQILNLAGERVREELEKILSYGVSSRALQLLNECGLFQQVFSEIAQSLNSEGIIHSAEINKLGAIVDHLDSEVEYDVVLAAILLKWKDLDKEQLESFFKRLRFSNKAKERIKLILEKYPQVSKFPDMSVVEAKKFVLDKKVREIDPIFEDLLLLSEADIENKDLLLQINKKYQSIVSEWSKRTPVKKLINGGDVKKALALKKGGKIIGEILQEVEERLLEKSNPDREEALGILKELVEARNKNLES